MKQQNEHKHSTPPEDTSGPGHPQTPPNPNVQIQYGKPTVNDVNPVTHPKEAFVKQAQDYNFQARIVELEQENKQLKEQLNQTYHE